MSAVALIFFVNDKNKAPQGWGEEIRQKVEDFSISYIWKFSPRYISRATGLSIISC